MSNPVDLSQLAVQRAPLASEQSPAGTRRWFSRYVLPLGIVLGFVGLLSWAMRDSLLPAHQVTVVPVLVARAEVQQSGTPLFQAAGWIEPRPVSTVVTSLTDGVIQDLSVVAGQRVTQGEVIAHLLDADAQLALRDMQAEVQLREADVEAAKAERDSARVSLDNPVTLRAELADAESSLAVVDGQLSGLAANIAAARTRRRLAQESVDNKIAAGDAISGRTLRTAQSDLATATATIDTLLAREPLLKQQQAALQRRRAALAEQLELKLEHRRRLADATAQLKAAEARLSRAALAVENAQLQLARTVIKSPIDGRVLSVQATLGGRVGGLQSNSDQGSSTVVTLYDPQMLQVRADVRLDDVPQVQLGQPVQIETASFSGQLSGQVISITSLADIQKNTLQVKVAIDAPPEVIRPEMLAQVTFLAPELSGGANEESTEKQRLLVPRDLVEDGDGGTHIWIADRQTKTAARRAIKLGPASTAELVEVASGLQPTDKLISSPREGLSDGARIRVAEDNSRSAREPRAAALGLGNGLGRVNR